MLGAAATGVALALGAAAAQSPLLRVRHVTWTGPIRLAEAECAAVEGAALGAPLLLLSEAALRARAQIDNEVCSLRLQRHLPATLEVRVAARRAVARLGDGPAIDARGRVLAAAHALPGLPRLEGFALDAAARRLERPDLLLALEPLFDLATLAPARIVLHDARGELEVTLAHCGTRVLLDARHAASQLLKLRVFEQSLGDEPLPGRIDLRFQDQVVVAEEGGARDARRAR